VIEAEPVRPSDVAVIVVVPGLRPDTVAVPPFPFAATVATLAFVLAQLVDRPVSTLPPPSRVVAVSTTVAPTLTLPVPGWTVTVATGTSVTVTSAKPDAEPAVAVIRTGPPTWFPVTVALVPEPETEEE
jgi:hypothetical protein